MQSFVIMVSDRTKEVRQVKNHGLDKQVKDAKKRMNVQRRRRRQKEFLFTAVWAFLGCVGICAILQWIFHVDTGGTAYGQEDYRNAGVKQEKTVGYAGEDESPENEKTAGRLKYSSGSGLLVIANKDYELPEDYDPGLRTICNGRLQAAAVMYDDLTAMLKDAGREGYDYWIASAYRSRKRQQELIDEDVEELMKRGMGYDEAMEKTLEETLPAGHSEHETGLSLDILCAGNTKMDYSQAEEPGNRWLKEHCAKYGFILRYPPEKAEITGIAFEPWHFRYVGKKAAKEIMERGITLEEYVLQKTEKIG